MRQFLIKTPELSSSGEDYYDRCGQRFFCKNIEYIVPMTRNKKVVICLSDTPMVPHARKVRLRKLVYSISYSRSDHGDYFHSMYEAAQNLCREIFDSHTIVECYIWTEYPPL